MTFRVVAMPLEMQSLLLSVFEDNKKRTPSCSDLLQRLREWDEAPEVTLSMPMDRSRTSRCASIPNPQNPTESKREAERDLPPPLFMRAHRR
jgi:hypothetical protein